MEHSATFETGESYFVESFRQSVAYLGVYRRWQILIAVLILATGASWLMYQPGFFPGMLVFLGIGQIADFYRFRRYWINTYQRRFPERERNTVALTASDSGLALCGLDDNDVVTWNAVNAVQTTPKGRLFSLGNLQPIYVPDSAFNDRQFKPFVARKVTRRGSTRADR
ncbi:MAG: hypothetical protein HKN35_01680 [Woeseia sp.]|nr:hypothetical protein [Woeseia sp.]